MIRLRLFSSVDLHNGSNQTVRSVLAQPKRVALLALLATSEGTRQPRSALMALLWSEQDEAHARNALNQCVHQLRRSLGPDVILSIGSDEIGLNASEVGSDVGAFFAALAQGEHRLALELCGSGAFMEGFHLSGAPEFERWLEATRAELTRRAAEAARALAAEAENEGDLAAAVEAARLCARLEPYDESALRRVLALMDRSGDRAAAVAAYEAFSRRIAEELELEPGPETRALVAEIRQRQEAPHEPRAVAPQPAGSGVHAPAATDEAPVTRAYGARGHARLYLAVGTVVVMAGLAAWGWLRPQPAPAAAVATRSALTGLDMKLPGFGGWRFAISADGRWIVAGDAPDLWVRAADETEWRRLPYTEGATNPTISPDDQWVAFNVEDGGIYKVPLAGGPRLSVMDEGYAPNWGADGSIVCVVQGALYRIPADGGEPEKLPLPDSIPPSRPYLLPGGRGVLFGVGSSAGVAVLDLESGEVRALVSPGSEPAYLPTGHLVYAHPDYALLAVPFDLETLTTRGTPTTIIPRLTVFDGGAAQYTVSATGTLVYDAEGERAGSASTLVEVALDGTLSTFPIRPRVLQAPRYTPDGRSIAYLDLSDLHIYDVLTGANPMVGQGRWFPVWEPSGAHLYSSMADGNRVMRRGDGTGILRRGAGANAADDLVLATDGRLYVSDVASGDSLLVVQSMKGGQGDLSVGRYRDGKLELADLLVSDRSELKPDISPDGQWVAYASDERGSGQWGVWAVSFPEPAERREVAADGTDPAWSPDGRRLYYRSGDDMVFVDVTARPSFSVSAPRRLFSAARYTVSGEFRNWDIHPDGTRFVMVDKGTAQAESEAPRRLSDVWIVTNWFEELKARAPGG